MNAASGIQVTNKSLIIDQSFTEYVLIAFPTEAMG